MHVLEGKWVWYEVCDGSNCWSMVEDGNGRVCGGLELWINEAIDDLLWHKYLGNFFVQFDVASFT